MRLWGMLQSFPSLQAGIDGPQCKSFARRLLLVNEQMTLLFGRKLD